jgi:CheY-like chemotaxis protein
VRSPDNASANKAAVSPAGPAPVAPADLNSLLEAWACSWRADAPDTLRLVWQKSPVPLHTTVPVPLLRSVVEALVQRARRVIGEQPGSLTLHVRSSEPDEEAPLHSDLEHPFIVISVGDDRPASDDPVEALGPLATSLAARQGALEVICHPGQGTVCRVLLPAVNPEHARRLRAPFPAHILMVEDEWTIATPAKLFLERAGYRVTTVTDAESALAFTRERAMAPDLLLTDIILPGMNGHLLLRTLRADYPDLPCLFMSGYTAESLNDLQQGLLRAHFIGKPFSSEQLLTTIHDILVPSGKAAGGEVPDKN